MTTIAVTPRGFRQTPGRHHDLLAALGCEVRYPTQERPLTAAELRELLHGCDGAILGVDDASAEALVGSGMKVLVRFGIGLDSVDLDAAEAEGIRVSRTLGATTTSVAELAVGLMLAAARGIPALDRSIRSGSWSRPAALELSGRTLGLVGIGRIGHEVAVRARALGMAVIGHDPVAAPPDIEMVGFDELIERADVISLHAPLTDTTRHLFDAGVLARMRPASILVNTARGGIVDEAALAVALREGPLHAAALDSFEEEPLGPDSPLRDLPNVILTPHAGASTVEAVERAGVLAVEELVRGLDGAPLLFEVRPAG
ncbi:phosphoglycerate dehydrogenase [Nocardioides aquiterrae]|uniref:Hydroxyacid dehydrogenase n=1 Tax=Nocardioides aquiterrae TaxID=203799 RepID=A0ABP4EVC8_9ACTN